MYSHASYVTNFNIQMAVFRGNFYSIFFCHRIMLPQDNALFSCSSHLCQIAYQRKIVKSMLDHDDKPENRAST